MTPFETLNDQIVYTSVKTRTKAMELKDDAKETVASGKTVVIFFENRYYLYLAPGHDPYQIRKEIEKHKANQTKAKEPDVNASSEPVIPKIATTSPETKTKKSFSKK